MEPLNYIFTLLISTIGISSIILYLGKRFIDKTLELGVEKYKSNFNRDLETLKAKLLIETEKFKADLNIIELEHQIKFSKLHEQRALTIKELYSLLIDLQTNLSKFTTIFQGPEWTTDTKKETDATQSLNAFNKYFLLNRIYFSVELCNQIEEVLRLCNDIIVDMSVTKSTAINNVTGPQFKSSLQEWRKQDEKVNKEINSARLNLEDEFRKLMGS